MASLNTPMTELEIHSLASALSFTGAGDEAEMFVIEEFRNNKLRAGRSEAEIFLIVSAAKVLVSARLN